MTKGHTSMDRSGLRNALLTILAVATVAGLTEIVLSLTQECLTEILLALGIANLVIAGTAAAYLQKPQPGEEPAKPKED